MGLMVMAPQPRCARLLSVMPGPVERTQRMPTGSVFGRKPMGSSEDPVAVAAIWSKPSTIRNSLMPVALAASNHCKNDHAITASVLAQHIAPETFGKHTRKNKTEYVISMYLRMYRNIRETYQGKLVKHFCWFDWQSELQRQLLFEDFAYSVPPQNRILGCIAHPIVPQYGFQFPSSAPTLRKG